ncbi:hypothetical protein WJX75_005314 [Coccomyxa subellipsoidea]|uniref:Uncharacterized protein n=1 Tax=Coccomyxa subellipsoidea TaxID=248742 RepID=A0ABR2YAQ7_9CHLO
MAGHWIKGAHRHLPFQTQRPPSSLPLWRPPLPWQHLFPIKRMKDAHCHLPFQTQRPPSSLPLWRPPLPWQHLFPIKRMKGAHRHLPFQTQRPPSSLPLWRPPLPWQHLFPIKRMKDAHRHLPFQTQRPPSSLPLWRPPLPWQHLFPIKRMKDAHRHLPFQTQRPPSSLPLWRPPLPWQHLFPIKRMESSLAWIVATHWPSCHRLLWGVILMLHIQTHRFLLCYSTPAMQFWLSLTPAERANFTATANLAPIPRLSFTIATPGRPSVEYRSATAAVRLGRWTSTSWGKEKQLREKKFPRGPRGPKRDRDFVDEYLELNYVQRYLRLQQAEQRRDEINSRMLAGANKRVHQLCFLAWYFVIYHPSTF